MGRLILLHTDDAEKKKQITGLGRRMGISVKSLGQADLNRQVGALAGIQSAGKAVKKTVKGSAEENPEPAPGQERAPASYQLPEVMIFSGFPDGHLDEFLGAYRKEGIRPVPLKAVVTPYNFSWTLYQLVQELAREHMAMLLRGR